MAVAGAAAFCLAICGASIPSSAQDTEPVRGAPCQPGQGVTVVVDFSIDGSDVDVRCAPGTYSTIADAFQGAGFTFDSPSYVQVIDGFNPSTVYTDDPWDFGVPEGNWGLYTSTVDGKPTGAPSDTWQPSALGADNGPVSVGQAYLFRAIPTYTCMMSMYPPYYDYATSTFDEDYVESLVDSEIIDDPSDMDVCFVTSPLLSSLGLMGGGAVLPSVPSATHGSSDAGMAAAWIASRLSASGDVIKSGTSTTDWGTTIDALIALASAGVGGNQIAATAAALNASGTAYVGAPDQVGTNWQSIAKMALGLEVAGLDPTNFGGNRDLIADLMSALNSDGSFGSANGNKVPFLQSLAMLALSRTEGGVPPQATAWMLSQQCTTSGSSNGSFGWPSGCATADPDSTSMAIQALEAAGIPSDNPAVVAAEQWLKTQQDSVTGGILSYGTPNSNSTGLAAQSLSGDTSFTDPARAFIAGLQVTCDLVEAQSPALVVGDIGAIAYSQDDFATFATSGLQSAMTSTQMATVQAVLGLGGPKYDTVSAAGVAADLPSASCSPAPSPSASSTTAEPSPSVSTTTAEPSPSVSTTTSQPTTAAPTTAAPTSSAPTTAAPSTGATTPNKVDTGGSADHSTGWFWLAPVVVILGGGLLRRAVTR